MRSGPHDEMFGKLCRLLMERGLKMHQDRRGKIVVVKSAGKPHPYVRGKRA